LLDCNHHWHGRQRARLTRLVALRPRWWDTISGEQQPCGSASIDYAVADLLSSQPQYSTLLKGADLVNVSGRGRGNRSSQEGGIFGGGSYAAESERENLSARNRPPTSERPVLAPPTVPTFRKPVNNESSIEGGIFGSGDAAGNPPPTGRTNRSNQSSVAGGIFNQEVVQQQAPRGGRNPNASSIQGGIFG